MPPPSPPDKATPVARWFAQRGWKIFPFQRAVWRAVKEGQSGLLHASTGSGKTYAVWFAALQKIVPALARSVPSSAAASPIVNQATVDGAGAPASMNAGVAKKRMRKPPGTGLRILWITPMRALAADTARALQDPLTDLLPDWTVGSRTGDTSSAERARQVKELPSALITTPESLSLLLSQPDAQARFAKLDMIIVDEWHELMGSKRGVQTQLAIARLRHWKSGLIVWGLSATLGNLPQSRDALLGDGVLIEGATPKKILVDTLIPAELSRFAWGGHLGLQMLPAVVDEIEQHHGTLVFTNTRSQAELWYQNILTARPDWAGVIALHHGSLDRDVREWVELGIKNGQLKAVVCTSSLDLGVDFTPVERVLQIGSAKGVARLLQRAGRSGHSPGRVSRVTLVPTNSLELLEAAGAQRAIAARKIEDRPVPNAPLDVLVQHLVTIALGGGFRSQELFDEVRTAYSYRDLRWDQWQWALDFVARGGQSLTVYPEYKRVLPDEQGVYRVPDAMIGKRHRMSIGTIVSDASMQVQYLRGARIGTIEEGFIARLKPKDRFLFGGRMLEFIRVHEMTAYVQRATSGSGAVPRWQGGRMPLSSTLAHAVLDCLEDASEGKFEGPEMQAVEPLLLLQQRWSSLPTANQLVVETMQSREGYHLFFYPFAGRLVHVGLGALLAYRLAKVQPATFSIAVNDYGFELLTTTPLDFKRVLPAKPVTESALFSTDHLLGDVLESLNAGELSQRRFREIARIAGLVFAGFPGQPKSMRQLQASSSLFFEVFRKHDSGNLLLTQAQTEVLEQELELGRLQECLLELQTRTLCVCNVKRATPFGFPLMVERFREMLSTEKLSDRVARMLSELEKAAAK
jgi:ATP-dependent Lhr-like helicase